MPAYPTLSSPLEEICDVLILGAGAAGLMAAITAGQRGRRVLVLDHADRIGKKILISGGGRCNFTNLHSTADRFLSANPHFARSALARYTPRDFIALVERHRIPYHEKTLGQLFCDRSARDIVAMLETEYRAAGARIVLDQHITSVLHSDRFVVETAAARYRAHALIVATGGLSIPKMGATDLAYRIAAQFDLAMEPCRPALVPLTWQPQGSAHYADLTGLSTEVIATHGKTRFREKLLFTHRGLSGPAILQISSYWKAGTPISIDLAPEQDCTALLRAHPGGRDDDAFRAALRAVLPQRLAERWAALHAPTGWSNRALLAAEEQLHRWEVTPAGKEGYAKAEVTAGGISTAELSAQTMESRRVPGLYFIGEAVDVTGHLGG
ncbi:MAG TPA: aminoacetone oxidase family FAD-binding enzyme, partial [Acidobacteriaceae bacterium]|nr:aminoacetone oxidase family FAD-binding enzyme [Acidobacteriaceae bacterium]